MGINMGSGFESADLVGEVRDWEEYQIWCDSTEVQPDDEGGMTDVEADADTFESCGWGTDEDYGYDGGDPYDC